MRRVLVEEKGWLTDQEYVDLVAYLLKRSQYPAGQAPLSSDPTVLKQLKFKKAA